MNSTLWFAAGVLLGATAVAATSRWSRAVGLSLAGRRRTFALAAGGLAVFACGAALLYLLIGARHTGETPPAAQAPHPVGGERAAGTKALSMEAATAGLEARLQRDGGSAGDWELLAKSYDFLGRPQDAARARAHVSGASSKQAPTGGAPGAPATPLNVADISSLAALLNERASAPQATTGQAAAPLTSSGGSMAAAAAADAGPPAVAAGPTQAELEQRLKLNPRDSQSWLALAELHRRKHEFDAARTAYERLTKLNAMTAQSWADYADVLGSRAHGSLGGAAGQAIEHALELDPVNPKALWLDASRALQERRYTDALGTWRRLRAQLEPGSPDAQLVDANIAEAQQLAQAHPAATGRDQAPKTNMTAGD
jgi:cytochrome c-type biogenesis protein CcmH/NrfG